MGSSVLRSITCFYLPEEAARDFFGPPMEKWRFTRECHRHLFLSSTHRPYFRRGIQVCFRTRAPNRCIILSDFKWSLKSA